MIVEAVCCSVKDCLLAQQAGAKRIELCSAIELGGLTPTRALVRLARGTVNIPIVAMVRPRPGGFRYTPSELALMRADAHDLLQAGADGVVFGILTEDGEIDERACAPLVEVAEGKRTMFHRAFDALRDPIAGLKTLERLGVTAAMTSGGTGSALDGAARLAEYRTASSVEIVAAGGIRPDNVKEIVEKTGCDQVHLGPFRCLEEEGYDGHFASILDFDVLRATVRSLKS